MISHRINNGVRTVHVKVVKETNDNMKKSLENLFNESENGATPALFSPAIDMKSATLNLF